MVRFEYISTLYASNHLWGEDDYQSFFDPAYIDKEFSNSKSGLISYYVSPVLMSQALVEGTLIANKLGWIALVCYD